MWKLYDDLIDAVPESMLVQEYLIGKHWTLVSSDQGMGIAKTVEEGFNTAGFKEIIGMPLKKLAVEVKSWNMTSASLGMAAINAAFNNLSNVKEISEPEEPPEDFQLHKFNAFTDFAFEDKVKKIAFVGYFPKIQYLRRLYNMTIIDKNPQLGDLPDSACEYVLPQQDVVFITGTAFINKSMPRLLQLSKKTKLITIGPSVPISQVLFRHGVDAIAGMIITDEKAIWKAVKDGDNNSIYHNGGITVCLDR